MISVCIPTSPMKGRGGDFLKHSLDILVRQTFKDFEIVITDDSPDREIGLIVSDYCGLKGMNISYYWNSIPKGMSGNTNECIRRANGDIVKVLFLDDFLYSEESLAEIACSFEGGWMINACEHTEDGINFIRPHYPKFTDQILFVNTLGCPSVLTFKNDDPPLFDEKLTWYMDTDFYVRCYEKWGEPKILNELCTVVRTGGHQVSGTINEQIENRERNYLIQKYK